MVFGLEDDLGFVMARTQRTMRRWLMARIGPLGITYAQFQVLNALCQEQNLSQSELAGRVNMDKTSLARMLDRMERTGLVDRRADPADSRINRVTLTDKGRHLQGRVTPLRDLGLSQAVDGLSEKEAGDLKRLLNQVYDNMQP